MLKILRSRALGLHAKPASTIKISAGLFSSATNPPRSQSPSVAPEGASTKKGDEFTLLFEGKQALVIQGMAGMSVFNMFYWTYYLAETTFNKESVANAAFLAGDPNLGFVGAFMTGLLVFGTRMLALYNIKECWVSADNKKLVFRLYNVVGGRGETLEAPVGSVKLAASLLGSSSTYIPVFVSGRDGRLVFARDGKYYDEPLLYSLLNETSAKADSKEDRVAWLRSHSRKSHRER